MNTFSKEQKFETAENYYILSNIESRKRANGILEAIINSEIINRIIKYKLKHRIKVCKIVQNMVKFVCEIEI